MKKSLQINKEEKSKILLLFIKSTNVTNWNRSDLLTIIFHITM